jgi:hypothetical protein
MFVFVEFVGFLMDANNLKDGLLKGLVSSKFIVGWINSGSFAAPPTRPRRCIKSLAAFNNLWRISTTLKFSQNRKTTFAPSYNNTQRYIYTAQISA